MPYVISGFDSAGLACEVNVSDEGVVSGDALLTGWLAENPVPDPPEGDPPHVSGTPLSDARLEQIRQHVSRLITYTQIAQPPPEVPPVLARGEDAPDMARSAASPSSVSSPSRHATHHTTAELEAMNVGELRDLARTAGVVGAASMSKAELVSALSTPHRSGSER